MRSRCVLAVLLQFVDSVFFVFLLVFLAGVLSLWCVLAFRSFVFLLWVHFWVIFGVLLLLFAGHLCFCCGLAFSYCVHAILMDSTATMPVTIFNETMSTALGVTCKYMVMVHGYDDDKKVPPSMLQLIGASLKYIIRLRLNSASVVEQIETNTIEYQMKDAIPLLTAPEPKTPASKSTHQLQKAHVSRSPTLQGIPFVVLDSDSDNDFGPGGNIIEPSCRKRKQTHTVLQKKAQKECHVIYIEEDDEEDDKFRIKSDPQTSSKKRPLVTSFCGICMDIKASSEMFENTKVCGHQFCSECIRGHVAAKIQENRIKITCPEPSCQVMIGPEACRSIGVPQEVLERWEKILCESVIMEAQKFYCPFKDCSAMLVDDGGVAVTSSECPFCHRLFCAQCKVAWHCGMSCAESQSVKRGDDNLLMKLAKKKKWMQCPKCKFMVEKVVGCQHISCRCGYQFCYGCGRSAFGSHDATLCKC
ncbi:hypothetical protein SSX86_010461 [Deinandra increscens subsp. villosa]|uniref:RBR-type E3 ubiquitin transferase n=1 Tax=Deinandra increscens subsp. villosa TaxID=3103831 RepID=A0AAP0H377_9ASTR